MFSVELTKKKAIIDGLQYFDLNRSCRCGQAFRWNEHGEGFLGVAGDKAAILAQSGSRLEINPSSAADIDFWINYLDLNSDYTQMLCELNKDERLNVCLTCSSGIRIFKQEPFETLISFIISANNNVKRISGSIAKLAALCGEKLRFGDIDYHAFPEPEAIAGLSIAELEACGLGYRAPYILDTAKRIAEGYDLNALKHISLEAARKELTEFKGVGPKVADCVLLFSLGHTDAFPVDVWMGRAITELFFNGVKPQKTEVESVIKSLGQYSGIAQQYIFHYARLMRLGKK